jgi:large repetitive protein
VVYGTPIAVRMDVGNSQATTTFPPQLVCAPLTCPTGNVTLTDTQNGSTSTVSPAGGFALNSAGFVEDDGVPIFSGGMHQLTASYPGDNSYRSSVGNYPLSVMPAPMQLSFLSIPTSPPVVGVPVTMYATFNAANSFPGAGPTGTITFYDGVAQIPGTVTYSNGQPGSTIFPASLTGYVTATFATIGPHQISAKYSGDANYAPASGSATSAAAVYATSAVATSKPATVNLGESITITVSLTGASKTPPITGTFQFSGQFTGLTNPITSTPGTDANGNQTLMATVTVTPQTSTSVYVFYSGDTNYESNETTTFVTVNIPDFSLNVPSPPLLISAAQPVSEVITVVPASNLPSTVSLSCGGNANGELPAGFNCGFSPATINLSNGASATSTFTLAPIVQTAAAMSNPIAIAARGGLIMNRPDSFKGALLLSGLLAVSLLVWPVNWPNRRLRTAVFIFGVVCLAVGCGTAPSGSGGGGGNAPGPQPPASQPTTITVTTSATKAASSTPLTFTATVNGSNHPTGSVLFFLHGNFTGSANLIGNTAVVSGENQWLGIYVLTAQYTGDAANNPSTSNGVNLTVTGTAYIGILGTTSTTNHFYQVMYTVQ